MPGGGGGIGAPGKGLLSPWRIGQRPAAAVAAPAEYGYRSQGLVGAGDAGNMRAPQQQTYRSPHDDAHLETSVTSTHLGGTGVVHTPPTSPYRHHFQPPSTSSPRQARPRRFGAEGTAMGGSDQRLAYAM